MAKILKGYRGQSNPEDPIENITASYTPEIMGGGKGKKGEETAEETEAAKMAKYEALVTKAEQKGWSDKKRIRKNVDANPKDFLPSNMKAQYNLKGDWTGTREKWGGNLRNAETGKIKKPHISIEKSEVEKTKQPKGRLNPFYNMSTGDKIKSRLKGLGPKADYWSEGFQADHKPATPHQSTTGIHGNLPTGETKIKRKINIDWR